MLDRMVSKTAKNVVFGEKMKNIIGRTEIISFSDLEIDKITAKVDTGAYGVVVHVDEIAQVDDELHIKVNSKDFIYKNFKCIKVKSSFGKVQKRYSILTKIILGDKVYKFYVSLTNRNKMRYPALIGRRFLYKFDYLVDVKQKNINDTTKKV